MPVTNDVLTTESAVFTPSLPLSGLVTVHPLIVYLRGWDYVSELLLLTDILFIPQMIYEYGERQWNDVLTEENGRTRRKTCPSATFSTTNLTWIDSGANPWLHVERPATNRLSHGTAHGPLVVWQTCWNRGVPWVKYSLADTLEGAAVWALCPLPQHCPSVVTVEGIHPPSPLHRFSLVGLSAIESNGHHILPFIEHLIKRIKLNCWHRSPCHEKNRFIHLKNVHLYSSCIHYTVLIIQLIAFTILFFVSEMNIQFILYLYTLFIHSLVLDHVSVRTSYCILPERCLMLYHVHFLLGLKVQI
jgi:hypothetical protein